jgi:topoisomerase-4 subunit A
MTDQPILDLASIPPGDGGDNELNLATYAQRAYLEYAL